MNRDIAGFKGIWRVLVHGLVELLMFLPAAMAAAVMFLKDGSAWLWFAPVPLCYPAGYALNGLLRFRHRAPLLLVSLILGIALGLVLFGTTREGMASAAVAWIALYRGCLMAVKPWNELFLPRHYMMGAASYFIISLILGRLAAFAHLRLPLIGFGIAALLLALFALNRSYVNDESMSEDGTPAVERTVRIQNRVMVAVTAAVTVLIVLSYQLQALLGSLWSQIREWLIKLFSSSPSQERPPASQPPPPQTPQLPKDGGSHLPQWVDLLLQGFAILIVLAVVWLLLRKLNRLPQWLRQLSAKIARMFDRENEQKTNGYVDEVESLRKPSFIDRFRRDTRIGGHARWKELRDNESRLRFLYRRRIGQSVKSGYSFKPHLTPAETGSELRSLGAGDPLSENFIERYNEVRYGGRKLSDDELQQLMNDQERRLR